MRQGTSRETGTRSAGHERHAVLGARPDHPGELVESMSAEELARARDETGDGDGRRWDDARALYTEMALADEYADFLTLPAYERMP